MIYDLTIPVFPGQIVWPHDPQIEISPVCSISSGEPANVSCLKVGTHTGTHLDAPLHLLDNGAGVDRIEPEKLIGPAQVLDLTGLSEDLIFPQAIKQAGFQDIPRVLFKTKNSYLYQDRKFHRDYVSISLSAAEWLIQKGVFLVGLDYLSVEAFDTTDYAVHKALLSQAIVLLEGITLKDVPPDIYELFCAPLKIVEGDGAPARAFLRTLNPRSLFE